MYELEKRFLNAVRDGVPFKVDFKNRSLRLGNKYLIKDGETKCKEQYQKKVHNNFLLRVRQLYKEYKFSMPSKRSKDNYFYALPSKEMTWEQMTVGFPREYAKAKLEGYILREILSGITWEEVLAEVENKEKYTWFYQDGDLVLLKEWFNK